MSSTTIYNSKDGIFRSPRPPISLPEDPRISIVPFLFRDLKSLSNSIALIDAETGQTMTFSELKDRICKLSQALLDLNISKGDVVLILSPNSILFPVSIFSVLAIGAIATTANPLYTIHELYNQVKDCVPTLVITVSELYDKVKPFNLPCILLSPRGSLPSIGPKDSICFYSDLIDKYQSVSELPVSSVEQTDVASLLYSSGTTGKNKGVILTHRNFIATASMVVSDQDNYGDGRNVVLCFLPLYHIFGLAVVLYAQLRRGNLVVVMPRFEMEKFLWAIEKYKVTIVSAVPPVVLALAKQKEIIDKYDLSSLKELGSGAAPLGKDVMEECSKNLPHVAIGQGYGMTETCGIIALENVREGTRNSGSTGALVPGVEAQILDIEMNKSLPPFHKGEILVRGENMMRGYLNNQEASKQTIDEQHWVHTGDLGYFDDKGQLYVVDRIKELIKVKGFQVAPAELEELLLAHPEISDAAVVPRADMEAGEVPVAYVVRVSASSLTEKEVLKYIAEQVAPYKRLRSVFFTESIPKSPAGKILRRQLREKINSKL